MSKELKPRRTMLGQILTDIRLEAGLDTVQLAMRINMASCQYTAYERGEKYPSLRTLERILDVTGHEWEVVKK